LLRQKLNGVEAGAVRAQHLRWGSPLDAFNIMKYSNGTNIHTNAKHLRSIGFIESSGLDLKKRCVGVDPPLAFYIVKYRNDIYYRN